MQDLLSGAIVMGYLVAGLYFLKFWKGTSDRLFLIFGTAFWLLALQRMLLSLLAGVPAAHIYLYVVRLLAFVVIIAAIVDKNRASDPAG